MSGLAAVLAGRRPAGVYRWTTPVEVSDVQRSVERAEWRFVLLDTLTVDDKEGFLASAAAAFAFPDWFGHNWDAFGDCLADVESDTGTLVLWDGWSPLARANRQSFNVALDILDQRAASRRGGPFVVLMRGDGPRINVPDVDPHVDVPD